MRLHRIRYPLTPPKHKGGDKIIIKVPLKKGDARGIEIYAAS
jgi:hypothetical protein